MELTLEQQRAIALAKAKSRSQQQQNAKLQIEVQANQPAPVQSDPNHINTREDFLNNTGSFAEPITTPAQAAQATAQKNSIAADQLQEDKVRDLANPMSIIKAPIAVGKGILNAGNNLNELGLSLADRAKTQWMGEPSDMSGEYRKNHPAYTDDSTYGKVGIGVGEVLPGMALGAGAGGLATRAVLGEAKAGGGFLANTARTGSNVASQEIGVAATSNKDQDPLLVAPFTINPNDDHATQTLKKTMNLASDNIVLALTFGAAGKGISLGAQYAKRIKENLTQWRNLDDIKKNFVGTIADRALKLPPDASAEQIKAAQDDLLNLIKGASKEEFDMGEGIGKKVVKKDVVSTITDSLDKNNPRDRAKVVDLESLRASAASGGAPELKTVMDQPRNALHETLGEVQATRGGNEAIEQTKQNLQRQAREEGAELQKPVQHVNEDIASTENDLHNTLRNDETFGPKIRENESAGVNLDINKEGLDKQTQLLHKTTERRTADKAARNDAYKAVGETGAPANMEEFNAAADKVKEFIPERVQKVIDANDGSFSYLNNEVRPRLSEEITAAYQRNDPLTARKLRELRDNITEDQMAHLTEIGSDSTAQAAQTANRTNKEFSDLHNQGIGKELNINEKINRPKTQNIDYIENGRNIILGTIKDPNRRESVQQLIKIAGPENEHLVSDIALTESMKDIINNGADFNSITKKLQDMSAALSDKQRMRIEGFLTDVRGKKNTIEELKKRLPELEAQTAKETDKLYMGKFEGLFKKTFGEHEEVGNGYEAFKKMMNNPETGNFDRIVEMAKKDPGDMAGLQAAWAKSAEETLSRNSEDIVPFLEEFEKNGKKVFGDTPTVESILKLKQKAKDIVNTSKARQAGGLDKTSNQTRAQIGINQLLTFAFGVLNPTRARLNTITSDLMKEYSSHDLAKKAADEILSNGDEFARIYRQVLDEARSKVSPATKRQLFRLGVNLGLYSARDQTEEATSLPTLNVTSK